MRTRIWLVVSILTAALSMTTPVGGAEPPETWPDVDDSAGLETLDGWVYFSGSMPDIGYELWRSDGVDTLLVADVWRGTKGSSPSGMTTMGDWLYFSAASRGIGHELWRTNGVVTELVADINPGAGSSWPSAFEPFAGWLYFKAETPDGLEFLRSNGSDVEIVGDPSPYEMEVMNGALYFGGSTGLGSSALFRHDGLTTVTVPGSEGLGGFDHLEAMDGWLYFAATSPDLFFPELFRSNGVDTTELVADIWPGSTSSQPYYLEAMGGWVYFRARTAEAGYELWRTNGVTTEMVADIVPGVAGSGPHSLAASDGWLYFSARTPEDELWRTNGTSTERVAEITALSPEAMGGWLYFVGYTPDDAYDWGLWRTDGSGTERIDGNVMFAGAVDASRATHPKWASTIHVPEADGVQTFTLHWIGAADLKTSVKDAATGATLGRNTSSDQPKRLTVDLEAGHDYKLNVWAKAGSTAFTVTVEAPPPTGEVIHSGVVDNDKVAGPKWSKTFFTPTVTDDHDLVLDWTGGGDLRIGVRERASNAWVGSNTTADHPKTLTVPLEAGVQYRVAVWSVAGVGDFTVTASPPG